MSFTIPPLLRAILAEADRIAPGRSHASDGTIGDAAHAASRSDHNPDSRGIVHAVDITDDQAHGFHAWAHARHIASRMGTGAEWRVSYLVSNDGSGDVIFNPSVSPAWRRQSGDSHRSHLHISIRSGATVEQSTLPMFTVPRVEFLPEEDDDMQFVLKDSRPKTAGAPIRFAVGNLSRAVAVANPDALKRLHAYRFADGRSPLTTQAELAVDPIELDRALGI